VSFSLYLAHVPVLSVMIILLAKLETMSGIPLYSNYVAFALLVVMASLVVAVFSWKWVEVGLTARVGVLLGYRRNQ
jgi:peptidoglycan/LPS O-acetylase OafA/YrhL